MAAVRARRRLTRTWGCRDDEAILAATRASLAEARKVHRVAIREIKAQRWCDFVSDLDANPWGFPQGGDAQNVPLDAPLVMASRLLAKVVDPVPYGRHRF